MVMDIRVLTSKKVVCSTTANEVIIPGLTGRVGVLDNHATLVTALGVGLLRIKLEDGKWTPILVMEGVAEVDRNRVTVLASDVEEFTDLELSQATKQLEEAFASVEKAKTENKGLLEAFNELEKANARVEGFTYLS
jgi:F-type H+-transporting ATPase subunit epsilon